MVLDTATCDPGCIPLSRLLYSLRDDRHFRHRVAKVKYSYVSCAFASGHVIVYVC